MRYIHVLGVVSTLLLALACGGGGGSGGGGGTAGTSSGAVSGVGSFIVTGTSWSLGPGATVELDGAPGAMADLQVLGLYLQVEGTRRSDGTGTATAVRYDEAIFGGVENAPVDAGLDQKMFSILGQNVVIDRRVTVFDGTSFDTLGLNDLIEVSGPSTNSKILALRIEHNGTLVPTTSVVEFKGQAKNASNSASGTFDLGPVTVSYDCTAGTDCTALTGGFPVLDDFLEVEGIFNNPTSVDAATGVIRPFTPVANDLSDQSNRIVEGVIDSFVSLSDFELDGVMVNAAEATLDPNDAALFGNGAFVEVEGDVESGLFTARTMKLRAGTAFVAGEITSDGLSRRAQNELLMFLTGIPGQEGTEQTSVLVDERTRFEDFFGGEDFLEFSELDAGDFIEVRGVKLPDGRLRASSIERTAAADQFLRGPVESVDTERDGGLGYTALGTVVPVDDTTLGAGGDAVAFLNGLTVGDLVQARDADGSRDRFDDPVDEVDTTP